MITVACCTLVGFFLLYCLDQIGAIDWLWEVIETAFMLAVVAWPVTACVFFVIGFHLAK